MDDLTRIAGIGRATAARLAEVGAGSFAALAGADPAALAANPALRAIRAAPGDLVAWIAAARQLAGQAAPARLLRVTGPAAGRWRAGRRFGADPVILDPAELAPAALAAILSDPALEVAEIPSPAPAGRAGAPAAGGASPPAPPADFSE
jgi:hypothetical protein